MFLTVQVQEVSNKECVTKDVFLGPVLRVNCFEAVQFLKPFTIQLPIFLRGQQVFNQDPTTCRVRVLFRNSDDEQKEWIDVTDDLVKPASFDGDFVNIYVVRFSW